MTKLDCSPANLRRLRNRAGEETGWDRAAHIAHNQRVQAIMQNGTCTDRWDDFDAWCEQRGFDNLRQIPYSHNETEEEYYALLIARHTHQIAIDRHFVQWATERGFM